MSAEFPAYTLEPPIAPAIALVCDSPHSGTRYPSDFRHAVDRAYLRRAEDTHVHALWAGAPAVGATLLHAHFPRSYIDPNRGLDDLDTALLDGAWPEPVHPGPKSLLGYGLVWRNVDAATPIYDRRLSVSEIQHRIDCYYRPYHAALSQAIQDTHTQFGEVWHLNLHSMPNNAYERLRIQSPHPLADFVLGDRDGTTCDPAFVALVRDLLRDKGYRVTVNDPYKGVQLIAEIGKPALNRHSMQIEIRRPVYMDEQTRERNPDFDTVKQDLDAVLRAIADYLKA